MVNSGLPAGSTVDAGRCRAWGKESEARPAASAQASANPRLPPREHIRENFQRFFFKTSAHFHRKRIKCRTCREPQLQCSLLGYSSGGTNCRRRRDGARKFLLRTAVWLTVVVFLLPLAPSHVTGAAAHAMIA